MTEIVDVLPFGDRHAICRSSEHAAIAELQRNRRPITDIWFKSHKHQCLKSAAVRIGKLSMTTMSAAPLHFETSIAPQLSVILPVQGSGTILEGTRSLNWSTPKELLTTSFTKPMICDYKHFVTITIRPGLDELVSQIKAHIPRMTNLRDRLLSWPTNLGAAVMNGTDYGSVFRRLVAIVECANCDADFLRRIGIEDIMTRLVAHMLCSQMGELPDGVKPPRQQADAKAVNSVCDHIVRNMGTVTTVNKMEAIAGVPYSALAAAFQSRYGCSPRDWQRSTLLDEARRRLKVAGAYSCDGILSAELGFLSPASFEAHYQRRFGELPSQTAERWKL